MGANKRLLGADFGVVDVDLVFEDGLCARHHSLRPPNQAYNNNNIKNRRETEERGGIGGNERMAKKPKRKKRKIRKRKRWFDSFV